MKSRRLALFIFLSFLFVRAGLYAQDKTVREYKPREQKLYIDIPLTIAEDLVMNVVGNVNWRFWGADPKAAYVDFESMRRNLDPKGWFSWNFEDGRGHDTFLVNQFFHPYAGGIYFAAARSNNLNFYWSTFSSVFGSFTWEALCEIEAPSANDFLTTVVGGPAVGEILHRLYIELDKKGGLAGKIGAFFVSPIDRITAAIRRYGPDDSPSKIFNSSLAFGLSWLNAQFFDGGEETAFWNTPSAFADFDLVYGNPFTAHSKTPFDQFDLNMSIMVTVPLIYNFTIISDGYLVSWLWADDDENQASNGFTLQFDIFVIDKGAIILLNNGRENLDFNANSLDYSIKWRRRGNVIFNKPFDFSVKTHFGISPWAVTDYNGGVNREDNNQYLWGVNTRLFFELRQMNNEDVMKNGQVMSLSLCLYDTWNIPNPRIPNFDINVIFLFSKIACSFPLTERLSFYAADSFLLLHCRLTKEISGKPDVTRWYNSAQCGLKVSF
jgi:hypothetical protein